MLYVIESIIWCIGMESEPLKNEFETFETVNNKIVINRTREFIMDYDNVIGNYSKSIEFSSHIYFIDFVMLKNLHRGISKDDLVNYVKEIADVIIKDIESEVI